MFLTFSYFEAYDFSFQAHLEDLAEKDATEKSDAAREAFLAELALDSKKAVRGGSDSSKQTQDKHKDRKKNKDYRKTKDSKVSICCLFFQKKIWMIVVLCNFHCSTSNTS